MAGRCPTSSRHRTDPRDEGWTPTSVVRAVVVDIDRRTLVYGAWAALEGAVDALRAEGLPWDAAIVDSHGRVIA